MTDIHEKFEQAISQLDKMHKEQQEKLYRLVEHFVNPDMNQKVPDFFLPQYLKANDD